MPRPVTLFTGQWADLPLEELAPKAKSFGYDGLELACWGDHLDIEKAADDPGYCERQRDILKRSGLDCWAISAHLQGQLVLDRPDPRGAGFAPEQYRSDPEKVREWGTRQMRPAARAAKNVGVSVATAFPGSPICHLTSPFPPQDESLIEEGFKL